MSPKEKAKELYNKYEFVYIQNYTSKYEVKQCALITVDEILNQYSDGGFNYKILNEEESNYWESVKHEIERL